VIGAGLAGLVAARRLVDAGLSVEVVEARDRVGGRTCNEDVGDGRVIDLGAMWVTRAQHRIARLLGRLGIETFETYDEEKKVALWGGRRYEYEGEFPRMGIVALLDILRAQTAFERVARTVPLEEPWAAPRADRLDGETLASWIRRNVFTASGRAFFELFSHAIFATEPSHVSTLHALFYARTSGGLQALLSVKGGGQELRIVGGTQRISLELARELGDRIRLRCPVRSIRQAARGVRVECGERRFDADYAIVAIPPALAGRIEYAPALSARRDQLFQNVPMGAVIRCMPVYDAPFWRAKGLNGQGASDRGPVKVTFDCSPHGDRPGVLLAFLLGDEARDLGALPLVQRRRIVLESLAEYFGREALSPRAYVEQDWAADEWARGAYGAHFAPGIWTSFGPELRRPAGRIHWAGAETAAHYNGQLEGAVESGERAADEVLECMTASASRRRAVGSE
jgi:monoamine oxidase